MTDRTTILVTGGAGFVGSHFARLAAEVGRRVVILDDHSGGEPVLLPRALAIEVVNGDIADAALVRRLCRERAVGSVAHFASMIQVGESVRAPEVYFQNNLVKTLTLLAAVRDEGVGACLFSSTAAVYGSPEKVPIPETARREPINAYGATKLSVELALAAWASAYDLRWAALRYFNAAGAHHDGTMRENHRPESHLIPLAIDAAMGRGPALTIFGSDYPTEDGTCVRDYIHVQDLAASHLVALAELERGETVGPVNLGTGTGYSVRQVVDAVSRVVGRLVPYTMGARREGDPPALVADAGRALAMLGWRANCSSLGVIVEDSYRSRRRP
jgi:UDP-glucose-4-epimerase GalE